MSERNFASADRVGWKLRAALESLAEFPERGAKPNPEQHWRELRVPFGRSGYVIEYVVLDDEVLVTRLTHARELRLRR
jgi:plasmid stabilization system protein ParE